MRKFLSVALSLVVVAAACAAVLAAPGAANAQGGGALELGQWVEGSLSNNQYEQTYTFPGVSGQVILVEMYPVTTTTYLDPALLLRGADGAVLAQNDDYVSLGAFIILELPADGEYSILATRSGGATGSSEGDYRLRVSEADLLEPGETVEVTIYSDAALNVPGVFVVRTEADATWAISFSQPGGDLYGSLEMNTWSPDSSYGDTIFELGNTAKVRTGTLNVDLTAGTFYVLQVQQAFFSYSFETAEAVISVTVAEAAQ